MSIFSAISSAFESGSGGSGSAWGTLFQAGSSILGGILGSNANKKASKSLSKTEKKKLKLMQRAYSDAKKEYGELKEQAQPAVTRLRQVVAAPNTLSEDQQIELADARRQATNSVNRSGLRGSGRAVTAAIKDVEGDVRRGFMRDNLARADGATSELAQPYFDATGQTANLILNQGQTAANSADAAGQAEAGATLANASLRGQTIGDVSSLIASEVKGRDSRYSDRLSALEKKLGLSEEETI
jgi:hypothetical protein